MANALTKETAAQLYLTATIMAFLREGGLNALGQKTGDYIKFVLAERGVDTNEFEDRLHESLEDASAMFPRFVKDKEDRKRAKRS